MLTSEPGTEMAPVWSPDGHYVYYRSENEGVFRKEADGTSGPVKVLDGLVNGPSQFVKDATLGSLLLYFGILPNQPSMDILILPLDGPASPRAIVSTPSADVEPQVSPDGKWLAYSSSETGAYELYVSPFPPNDQKGLRISRSGGHQAMWRADSQELFFVNEARKFYVVRIPGSGPAPDIAPEFLFDMHANVANIRNSYVPSADGQRFLVNMVLDTNDAPINIISSWPARIK